jgi:hypothetical protein
MPVSDKLRSELMAFQKVQADLSRWKLIMIGAVFTYALGKNVPLDPNATSLLILAVAPPLAVFFDVVQYNYDIRIAVIAFHLALVNSRYRAYEEWVGRIIDDQHVKLWQFSQLANWVPSTIVCSTLLAWGIWHCHSPIVAISGAVSLVLLILARYLYSRKWDGIHGQYKNEREKQHLHRRDT